MFRADDVNSNTYARFPVEVNSQITTFTSADNTNTKQIITNNTTTLGYRVDLILVSSNDSVSNIAKLYLHNGTILSTLPIGHCTIPSDSGVGGTNPTVSILRSTSFEPIVSLDNNGNPFVMLGVGWSIHAAMNVSVSVTKTVQFTVWAHSY